MYNKYLNIVFMYSKIIKKTINMILLLYNIIFFYYEGNISYTHLQDR